MSGFADPPRAPIESDLEGWIRLRSVDIDPSSGRSDLENFFDGAAPNLDTVLNPNLAPLRFVTEIINDIQRCVTNRISGVTLIRGPSGEGKSTALLQCAVQFAKWEPVVVFLRENVDSALPLDTIGDFLARGESVLFIADSAESLINDIDRLSGLYRRASGGAVHFLLAARASDWTQAWRNLKLPRDPVTLWQGSSFAIGLVDLGGPVEELDARTIAQNWSALGGLKSTRLGVKSEDDLSQWIHKASKSQEPRSGALYGALLQVRFDKSQLRSRIATVLDGLRQTQLPSGRTLAELLLAIAAAYCASIDNLPREIIARMAGVEPVRMQATVAIPLGHEAVVGHSSTALHVRHPRIAIETLRMALDEADETLFIAARTLVEATVSEGESNFYAPGYGHFIDLGRRLIDPKTRVTSKDITSDDLLDLAIEASRAAVQATPTTLSNRISFSRILREHKRANQAVVEVWRKTLPELVRRKSWHDWTTNVRAAWAEAGAALSVAGYYKSAMRLVTLSISDRISTPLNERQVVQGISQIGLQAVALTQIEPDRELVRLITKLAGVEIRRFPNGPSEGQSHSVEHCRQVGAVPDRDADPEQTAALVASYVSQSELSDGTEWLTSVLDSKDVRLSRFVRFLQDGD
jgi:hypothetical protein